MNIDNTLSAALLVTHSLKRSTLILCCGYLISALTITVLSAVHISKIDRDIENGGIEIQLAGTNADRNEVVLMETSNTLATAWRIVDSTSISSEKSARLHANIDQKTPSGFFRITHMIDVFRTPEDRFADQVDFPFPIKHFYPSLTKIRLGYIDEGEGKPIVILGGEIVGIYKHKEVIPALLESGRRVIAIDLPGIGFSDKPEKTQGYRIPAIQEQLEELIFDHLSLENPVIAAHSWSTMVSSRIGVDHQENVAGLVYLGGGFLDGSFVHSDLLSYLGSLRVSSGPGMIESVAEFALIRAISQAEMRGMQAPYPTSNSTAGIIGLWENYPTSSNHPSAESQRAYTERLLEFEKPVLIYASPYWNFLNVFKMFEIPGAGLHNHHYEYEEGGWYEMEYPNDVAEGLIWTESWPKIQ